VEKDEDRTPHTKAERFEGNPKIRMQLGRHDIQDMQDTQTHRKRGECESQ